MRTITKLLAVALGSVLVATVAIAADETIAPRPGFGPGPGYGPGWRHEQMAEAFKDGKVPPMMMGRGPGRFARGPAIGADGKVDTSKLPEWCPFAEQAKEKTE